jgi:transforming growth factor-beta-induced protein
VTVPDQGGATTWDIIANSPDLSQMRDAIERAGVVDLFDGDQGITALASSNAAFDALRATPDGEELLNDPDRLAALLRRQVVVEALTAAEFPGRGELQTAADAGDCALLGADDTCSVLQTGGDAGDPTVEGASFLVKDVEADNGLLDVIDRVLVP